MFLRTGKRGFFDEAEAWIRYHTDLQAWRDLKQKHEKP
jgi:hypothetical protein